MRSLLLLPLLLVAGCSSFGREPGALAEARARWAASGTADYTMTQERMCFCPTEYRGPFVVTVRDGAVVAVTLDGASLPTDRALSVEALFDLVAAAYDRRADDVQVSYHPTLGYPTSIQIDYERQAADEELGLTVTALQPE